MHDIRRNCNTCRSGLFALCDALKENDAYQEIWRRAERERGLSGVSETHKFKENFICDEYECRYIEYPIEVSDIAKDTSRSIWQNYVGRFVRIRPCEDNKTYLGLHLGDLPIDIGVSYNNETKVLSLSYHENPAIFVFDLNVIVFGARSWWSVIKNEDELREITDDTINNVWYVKALRQIAGSKEDEKA